MTATQRWTHREPSWRHTSDGGFNPGRYDVVLIDEATARDFVLTHHYSGTWPSPKYRYGLYDGGDLVGVNVLGIPTGANVLTNPLPGLVPFEQSLELSRLVLLDEVPANAESWFTAEVFRRAARYHGIRGVVAFSDPDERKVGDRLILPGHVGTIYQALNATYTGRATPRSQWMLRDGSMFSPRARAKITGGERGAAGAVAQLVRRGADPLDPDQDPRAWIRQALRQVGAVPVRHQGVHRYVFKLGTPAIRRRVLVGMPALPYPKQPIAA